MADVASWRAIISSTFFMVFDCAECFFAVSNSVYNVEESVKQCFSSSKYELWHFHRIFFNLLEKTNTELTRVRGMSPNVESSHLPISIMEL